ncbi:MAG TPA: SLBB domain-containing protein [Longimicrobiales bacterium]|nr:SLBB domain-containing protein [Longimicrobiales bacterium]
MLARSRKCRLIVVPRSDGRLRFGAPGRSRAAKRAIYPTPLNLQVAAIQRQYPGPFIGPESRVGWTATRHVNQAQRGASAHPEGTEHAFARPAVDERPALRLRDVRAIVPISAHPSGPKRSFVRHSSVVLWFGLAATAALPSPGSAQAPPDAPEVLHSGDILRVQVWRQPELSGEFAVTEEGVVAHPLYREVTVAGRPIDEIHGALHTFLLRYEAEPNLVVEPLFRVAVGGEVRQPNVFLMRPGTTVAEAVAMAGGFAEQAAADRTILRRGSADYRIDLTDPAANFRNTTVRSGDQIVLERDRAIFRNYVVPFIGIVGSIASVYRVFN